MSLSRLLIIFGLSLVALGLLWPVINKIGLGRLPDDIVIERDNFQVYIPLATSQLVSVILSLILWRRPHAEGGQRSGSVRGRPAGSIIVCAVSSHGIHINCVACTQNVKGLAASNKLPIASKDGVARRLIDICSQSPFGDCR